jgi:hypothetical protein
MAASGNEQNAKAGAIKEEEQALKTAIVWNSVVKWALGVFVFVCWVFIFLKYSHDKDHDPLTYQLHPYRPEWFALLALWIFATGFWGFVYVKFERARGFPLSSSFELTGRAKDFPLMLLLLDFLNLALLVAVTGRLESIFIPLFLAALLLGDISIRKRKRRRMLGLYLAAVLCGVLLPEIDPIRYVLINHGHSTSAGSLWVLPKWPTIGVGLALSLGGAVFGSSVVRWYKDRTGLDGDELEQVGGEAA